MTEKTAQEIANEEMERAIARGDYLEGEEPEINTDTEDDQGIDGTDGGTEDAGSNDSNDQEDDSVSGVDDDAEDGTDMDNDGERSDSDMGSPVEDDTEEDGDEESEEDDEPQDNKIPKSRLDKVIAQREAAKERNEWLEAQLEKALENRVNPPEEVAPVVEEAPAFNFEEAEENYLELLLAGDTAKAAKIRGEINRAQAEQTRIQIQEAAEVARTEAKKELAADKFETTVVSLESQYPFLDHNSDSYNEEAVDAINTMMTGYINSGLSDAEAILKAVKTMSPIYSQSEEAPEEEVATAKKSSKAKDTKAKKAKQARSKNIAANNAQPAKMIASSKTSDGIGDRTINDLSEKEFSALTAKERAVLRGDVL